MRLFFITVLYAISLQNQATSPRLHCHRYPLVQIEIRVVWDVIFKLLLVTVLVDTVKVDFIATSIWPVLRTGIQVCRQILMVRSPIGNKKFSFLIIELDYIAIPLQCVAAWPRQHTERVLAPVENFALTFWTQSSICFFKFQAFLGNPLDVIVFTVKLNATVKWENRFTADRQTLSNLLHLALT